MFEGGVALLCSGLAMLMLLLLDISPSFGFSNRIGKASKEREAQPQKHEEEAQNTNPSQSRPSIHPSTARTYLVLFIQISFCQMTVGIAGGVMVSF